MAPALALHSRCTGQLHWSSTVHGSTRHTTGIVRQTSRVSSRSKAAFPTLKRQRS